MYVRFWGVRGSTPTPQPENMRYGGNTPCVEVRRNGQLYVFDCGTGFRNLGKHLAADSSGVPIQAHLFISHFHWDHIQGIPFFQPLYAAENRFFFHSSSRNHGFREALEGQMVEPYFPVQMSRMAAQRKFYGLGEGRVEFDGCRLETHWLNHPQGCLGFRLETPEGILVYATDNEPDHSRFDISLRKLSEGADLLIYDSQYLPDDYASNRQGWGHSHWREAVKVAQESSARQLLLFHHDPDLSDTQIDSAVSQARDFHADVCAASEGMEITLGDAVPHIRPARRTASRLM
jgi:phosphoribosyl 1,2-cyclic phosphodiesterase